MNSTRRRIMYWGIGLILAALVLSVLVGFLVWPSSTATSSNPWGWMGGMMGGYFPGGGLMMTVGMLSMALFWFGVILLAVWAIRAIATPSAPTTGSPTPLEILKTRYAKGEIDRQEFERMKQELS